MAASLTTQLRKQFRVYDKDPADVLDYLNNWQPTDVPSGTEPFLADGETITTSTWAAYTPEWVAADDIAIDSDSHTDTTATVWLSGGIRAIWYFVTNHVVTDQGREKDWSFIINMKEQ